MACANTHYAPESSLLSKPRYLVNHSAASTSSTPHKRAGTLRTTPAHKMISQQRSKALYQSVYEGEISIDAILAFPIDWQGIATELQWTKSRMETIDEESDQDVLLATMNPLAIKERIRSASSKRNRHAVWATASAPVTPTLDSEEESVCSTDATLSNSSYMHTSSSHPSTSILGLQIDTPSRALTSASPLSTAMDLDGPPSSSSSSSSSSSPSYCASPQEMEFSSSPFSLYSSSSSSSSFSSPSSSCSSSSSDSPLATPTLPIFTDLYPIQDPSSTFDLKSICTLFNSDPIEIH